MIGVARSEWTKMARPGMAAALLAAIAITCLATVLAVTTAGDVDDGPGQAMSMERLTGPYGLGVGLSDATTVLGVISLSVVASAVAGEYSTGMLRNTLLREPRRVVLLLGRFAGLAVLIAAAVVLAAGIAAGAGLIAAVQQGIDTEAWGTATGINWVLSVTFRMIAACLAWSAVGALLGIAFRSPAAATGVGVAYALPLENILAGISSSVGQWLPGQVFAALVTSGNERTGMYEAGVLTACYAAAAAGGAITLFSRRDVTA